MCSSGKKQMCYIYRQALERFIEYINQGSPAHPNQLGLTRQPALAQAQHMPGLLTHTPLHLSGIYKLCSICSLEIYIYNSYA